MQLSEINLVEYIKFLCSQLPRGRNFRLVIAKKLVKDMSDFELNKLLVVIRRRKQRGVELENEIKGSVLDEPLQKILEIGIESEKDQYLRKLYTRLLNRLVINKEEITAGEFVRAPREENLKRANIGAKVLDAVQELVEKMVKKEK